MWRDYKTSNLIRIVEEMPGPVRISENVDVRAMFRGAHCLLEGNAGYSRRSDPEDLTVKSATVRPEEGSGSGHNQLNNMLMANIMLCQDQRLKLKRRCRA